MHRDDWCIDIKTVLPLIEKLIEQRDRAIDYPITLEEFESYDLSLLNLIK